jgi:hypothetical protein
LTNNISALSQNYEKRLISSLCLRVSPHGTNSRSLEGFSWNLIFRDLPKICREYSSFIKIWGEKLLLYMSVIKCRWILLRMISYSDKNCKEN